MRRRGDSVAAETPCRLAEKGLSQAAETQAFGQISERKKEKGLQAALRQGEARDT